MSTQLWVVLVVVLIVIAVFVYLRSRRTQVSQAQDRRMSIQAEGRAQSPGEEISQREEHRLAGMTAEDREWEQASLQRNRERVERAQRATETN
jgi:flagellar biosynthesis/type III secretory pathway M-ring protein FliF/YscJ